MSATPDKLKESLRREMISLRSGLSKEERKQHSEIMLKSLFQTEVWKRAEKVMAYMPLRTEVQCQPVLEKAIQEGKKVFLPKISADQVMSAVPYEPGDALEKGSWGGMEPKFNTRVKVDLDLILVPGLAFDAEFNRLGFGQGNFDRFLSTQSGFRLALAFEVQMVESVPVEKWDLKMDGVLTEGRFLIASSE